MHRIEPFRLRLCREAIRFFRSGGLPGVRVLHLSDFHLSATVPLRHIRRAVHLGLQARPTLACITGDFVTGELPQRREYGAVLRELSQCVPTYACLGNHDGGRWAGHHGAAETTTAMTAFLADAGIVCLFNASRVIRAAGQELCLVGLGDLWAGDADPATAFQSVPSDRLPVLVLCHNPDAKDLLRPYRWDLMLCGHTHGGQLRLPLLGTPFAPVRDQRYVAGLHGWSGRMLYVTAGVGSLHGLRLNCPPEVAVLDLVGAEAAAATGP